MYPHESSQPTQALTLQPLQTVRRGRPTEQDTATSLAQATDACCPERVREQGKHVGPGPDPQTGTPSSSRESVQKPQARAAPAGWADRSESGQPQDHLLRRRLTKAPSREARRAVPEAETETPGPRQPAHSQTTGTGSSASPLARLYPTTQLLESTALAHCRASHKFTWSCFMVAAAWGQTLTHGGRRHV